MNTAPLKILVVDNEQLLLWALERAGKGRALNISTAASNEQALEKISRGHFDLFLLDFDLKDSSNLLLLKLIDAHCPYVPVIIMTTSDLRSSKLNDAIRAVRKQGAWHLLEKPFRLDQLTEYVKLVFQDRSHPKFCVSELKHNFDSEKRRQLRQPHVLPLDFAFKSIVDGQQQQQLCGGIIIDISDRGAALLSHIPLERDLVIDFSDELSKQYGVVVWSRMLETLTCRAGICLC
ncbi:MAG: response regulator [Desulfuromonadaceae bacterium]|nr:response regulator [Desulfuromonadaceae bacterium]